MAAFEALVRELEQCDPYVVTNHVRHYSDSRPLTAIREYLAVAAELAQDAEIREVVV